MTVTFKQKPKSQKPRTSSTVAAPASRISSHARNYRSAEIDLNHIDADTTRADIIFDGVTHSGCSYEARVFINNPRANVESEKSARQGYAGSFYIFGHGGCTGDPGHCEVKQRETYDPRPAHPLVPATKVVIATNALKQYAKKKVTLTVVPVVVRAPREQVNDKTDVLKFETLSVVSYEEPGAMARLTPSRKTPR